MNCTGITYGIQDGTYKGPKDFLKMCLRSFGVLVSMRDEPMSAPIPTELKVSDYYSDELKESQEELEKLISKTPEDWIKDYNKELEEARKELEDAIIKRNKEAKILQEYTDAISNWNCSEEYKSVKEFALDQLNMTTPTDTEFYEQRVKSLESSGVEMYKKDIFDNIKRQINYATEHLVREKQDVAEKNNFLKGFLKEIEKVGN